MSNTELMCANCGQALDAGDMFCRSCGLPTVLAYASRVRAVEAAPDLQELERSLEIAPEPEVLARVSAASMEQSITEPLQPVARPAPARRGSPLSPLAVVMLVALLGAVAVFFLLLALG
ncbi:MAG TPA: zinc ribbon domain-containing protein [Anaerolineales bacterium]|nr:zinc ribbon domain-containing protein [Anaerolineales bacterium]